MMIRPNVLPLAMLALTLVGPVLAQEPAEDFDPGAEAKLVALVNQARADAGLPALTPNDPLRASARRHAIFLAANHRPAASFPGEPTLQERYAQQDILEDAAAENFSIATDVVSAHDRLQHGFGRNNILDPKFTVIGVGVFRRGKYYFIAEDFAHFVAVRPVAEIEAEVLAAINQTRTDRKRFPLKPIDDLRLRASACAMAADDDPSPSHARISQRQPGSYAQEVDIGPAEAREMVITYVTVHPEIVPAAAYFISNEPLLTALSVGACFQKTKTHPEGTYWIFAVAHYRYTQMR